MTLIDSATFAFFSSCPRADPETNPVVVAGRSQNTSRIRARLPGDHRDHVLVALPEDSHEALVPHVVNVDATVFAARSYIVPTRTFRQEEVEGTILGGEAVRALHAGNDLLTL